MTDQEETFRARLFRRRIDHMADGWWLACPTHGRSPVHPYDRADRCFYCVETEQGR